VTSFSDVRDTLGSAIRKALPELNVYNYVPRSLIPPAAIVQPAPHNTIDYEQQYSSSQADWLFIIMIVVGQVDDEAAQDQVGELITPGSDLINAVNGSDFGGPGAGWARVQRGGVSQMNFGKALYTYAELTVRVTT
jgi:hypothetical protein